MDWYRSRTQAPGSDVRPIYRSRGGAPSTNSSNQTLDRYGKHRDGTRRRVLPPTWLSTIQDGDRTRYHRGRDDPRGGHRLGESRHHQYGPLFPRERTRPQASGVRVPLIVFENLTYICDQSNIPCGHRWAFRTLDEFVEYKAYPIGVSETRVQPDHSSILCLRCDFTAE